MGLSKTLKCESQKVYQELINEINKGKIAIKKISTKCNNFKLKVNKQKSVIEICCKDGNNPMKIYGAYD